MSKQEVDRIVGDLDSRGYALTYFHDLGLEFDPNLVSQLRDASADGTFSASAAKLTEHIEKAKMVMIQDEKSLSLGRQLVAPVVETLFAESPRAIKGWSLYAMNRYEEGGVLGSHQDSVASTVMVATVTGVREFDVFKPSPSPDQEEVLLESFLLTPGSVMILDGQLDPGHAVRCVEGPSLSAVFDVPDLLRVHYD